MSYFINIGVVGTVSFFTVGALLSDDLVVRFSSREHTLRLLLLSADACDAGTLSADLRVSGPLLLVGPETRPVVELSWLFDVDTFRLFEFGVPLLKSNLKTCLF